MKVYTKIKIDIATGQTLAEESFDYEGPVARCCIGGGSSSPDPPPLPPKPVPPKEVTAASNDARASQKEKARRAAGVKSGVLTTGLGMEEDATVEKKRLMGA